MTKQTLMCAALLVAVGCSPAPVATNLPPTGTEMQLPSGEIATFVNLKVPNMH